MDRLRDLKRAGWALLFLCVACEEPKSSAPPPSRFQAVVSEAQAKKAGDAFCEVQYPARGAEARRWTEPASRPLPKKPPAMEAARAVQGAGWTWINLWASWCGPCLKEMPLIGRWRESLAKEGLFVDLQLWSVDATEQELMTAIDRPFPGVVRWLRSEADLPALLEALGIDKGSAIPVHALIDPQGNLRCVRVGSIGEESYGQLKSIVAGP